MVSKDALVTEVWEEFFDLIEDNITSVTITGNKTISIEKVAPGYNDILLDNKNNYPMIIVQAPTFYTEQYSLTKTRATAILEVTVLTTQKEACDRFTQAILNLIELNKLTFKQMGVNNLDVQSMDYSYTEHNKTKLHVERIRFTYDCIYSRTQVY